MANAEVLRNLLEKVYLKGTVENCKISCFEDGLWLVEAIDERSSVIMACQAKVMKGIDADLGIGDIATLIKWLKLIKNNEIDIEYHKNRIKLISDNFGTLDYLLREIDKITTQQEISDNNQSDLDMILEKVTYEVELPKDVREGLVKIMEIIKPQVITLVFNEGEVSFTGGNETSNQFELPIGTIKNSEDQFSVSVDGKSFLNVLAVVDGVPEILFTDKAPIVIRENADFMYAINTLVDEE